VTARPANPLLPPQVLAGEEPSARAVLVGQPAATRDRANSIGGGRSTGRCEGPAAVGDPQALLVGSGGWIPALSVRQPWATLLALRFKRVETRPRGTAYRGWIGIHASKRLGPEELACCFAASFAQALADAGIATPAALPLGAVLAVARLVDVQRIDAELAAELAAADRAHGTSELAFGNYTFGRSAWRFAEVVPLPEPIDACGALGLWSWTPPPGLLDQLGLPAMTVSQS
jgi:activating signal cointegrator 1